jgi:hypothetical protein
MWLQDCGLNLGEAALAEFFTLWQVFAAVQLALEREDSLRWCWTSDGVYSSKSAYGAFFGGRARATASSQIWRLRAPYGCKFFVWIVSRGRCGTADQLERHRLPHSTACPLCNQAPKTLQHLLLGCVVAQEIWVWALNLWDMMPWLPPANVDILHLDFPTMSKGDAAGLVDLHYLALLVHLEAPRNDVVFNGARPDVEGIRVRVREAYGSWRLARLLITNAIIIPPRHTAEPTSNSSSVDGRTSELLDPWLQRSSV